jgi:hypothetical protein
MKPVNYLRIWRVEGLMDVFSSLEVLLDSILYQWALKERMARQIQYGQLQQQSKMPIGELARKLFLAVHGSWRSVP